MSAPAFFHAQMVAGVTLAMIASWRCVMRVDVFLSRVFGMPQICRGAGMKARGKDSDGVKIRIQKKFTTLLLSVEFGLSSRKSGGKPGATTNQRGKT